MDLERKRQEYRTHVFNGRGTGHSSHEDRGKKAANGRPGKHSIEPFLDPFEGSLAIVSTAEPNRYKIGRAIGILDYSSPDEVSCSWQPSRRFIDLVHKCAAVVFQVLITLTPSYRWLPVPL